MMIRQWEETLGGDGYDTGLGGNGFRGCILIPKLIKLYTSNMHSFYMLIMPQQSVHFFFKKRNAAEIESFHKRVQNKE